MSETITIDEIKMYFDARYVLASKSIWRIFCYRMHSRIPNVQRLAIHFLGQQNVTFQDEKNIQNVVERANTHMTTLMA